jgi:hypothetical protein
VPPVLSLKLKVGTHESCSGLERPTRSICIHARALRGSIEVLARKSGGPPSNFHEQRARRAGPEKRQQPHVRPGPQGLASCDPDRVVTVRASDDDDDIVTLHERNEAGCTPSPGVSVVHRDLKPQAPSERHDLSLEALESAHECDAP